MANTRALQRKLKRFSEIENFAKGNLLNEAVERIKVNINLLNEEWAEYKLERDIYGDTSENITLQEQLETKYFSAKGKLMEAELTLGKTQPQADLDGSLQELMANQKTFLHEFSNMTTKGDNDVRLPRINVPIFSGIYSEFASFRDLFDASINNNPRISKVHKLQYLKGLLRGEAATLIRHVAITDANYDEAWDIIVSRYDKKKHVINLFLKQFMDQPSIVQPTAKSLHHMRDVSDEVLRGMKVLGEPVQSRDPWLIYILVSKLDLVTKQAWAQHSYGIDFPTVQQFFEFLNKQSDTLESCETTKKVPQRHTPNAGMRLMQTNVEDISCVKCNQNHYLRNCDKFLDLPVDERRGFVAEKKLCFVCLYKNHQSSNCRSRYRCSICKARHHTTLHQDIRNKPITNEILNNNTTLTDQDVDSIVAAHAVSTKKITAILPTAEIRVLAASNEFKPCRVLLDSGAQASFISEAYAQRLAIPRTRANFIIKGLTAGTEITKGKLTIRASSIYSSTDVIDMEVLILDKLTNCLPAQKIDITNVAQIKQLQLADPHFNKPERVDMILGADRFFSILREGRLDNLGDTNLVAQNSMFGWIISGETTNPEEVPHVQKLNCHIELDVDQTLRRFWEMEELISISHLTPEDNECEEHFKLNIGQRDDGRFIVGLPFKKSRNELGSSEMKCHMVEIQNENTIMEERNVYYLPHHGVFKDESSTTKLRVVFDGSSKTTNGHSLNDQLMVGPTLQPTLWMTLMKFRYNKIAFIADIEKMYRQVLVTEKDRNFQRILWRDNKNDVVKHYQLTTVTFGMASSAFLAIRCLLQIASDVEENPFIAEEIKNKFYIDDYISGANTMEQAHNCKTKVTSSLAKRGFNLRKWRSNIPELWDENIDKSDSTVTIEEANSATKILGLQWSTQDDMLSFKVDLPLIKISTKRTLISDASKIFDPLGLVSPSIIIAKILYQKLWLKKLEWDEELPDDIAIVWNQLKTELPQLEKVKIDRFVKMSNIELHGFSDASERAYAAVIYGRFSNENGEIQTELLAAKTKVAPIAQVSLPRLELCGAHLLAKLMHEVKKTMNHEVVVYAWTDSNIVLSWLSDHPTKWKTFVANRVSDIQRLLPRNHWQHVKSESNPADYASRGVLPSKLLILQQCWHGPSWLCEPQNVWPTDKQTVFYDDTICEIRRKTIPLFHACQHNVGSETFEKYVDSITSEELQIATEKIIKWVQHTEFAHEIQLLVKNQQLGQSDKLSTLAPYVDEKGLLRVGGRLTNSNLTYETKHPIILPKSHILSKMIITYYHKKYLHPSLSLTSHLIRQKYWIVKGRALVRDQVKRCIQCFKNSATTTKQLMGNLPAVRVTPANPFSNCGIDYAGPITLASKKGRGPKLIKGYIAVFVCMVTKAIHLEAVTDLTTDAFIAALKRFSARRNAPRHIYSNNGTNFVGARRRLKEVYKFNNLKINQSVILEYCTENQINWHHIPSAAPHFGGLWESSVKSVKTHINKVTGNCHLTYEEMSTLLCQIESILNSRPLCPISEDDNSVDALTPAHFLIGSSAASVPEYNLEDTAISRLSRWQHVEQRAQHFWKRFNKEYLNNLQQRYKWKREEENIKVGDLVLIKEDNLPALKWAVGRIITTHPDDSGSVRVVTIKTSTNLMKRPITKVCMLPLEG